MSFELTLLLICDSCVKEEDYGPDLGDMPYNEIVLPDGWQTHVDDGAAIFDHVCSECAEEIQRERKEADSGLRG